MRFLLPLSFFLASLVPFGAVVGAQASDEPGRTAAEPAYVLDARRLRALFLDLYGRPPISDERARWAGQGAAELLDVALDEPEFWRNWLTEELYFLLLIDNFRPTSERVLALPERLAAGELGVRDALVYVALSASFDRRNPGPDTFVTVVLEQFRGENVQANPKNLEVGKKLYDGTPARFLGETGRTQADVVSIALGDRHALEVLLARAHRRLLAAEPESRALGAWARRLENDPLAFGAIVREWLLSDAYEARLATRRTLPNHTFVRALFVDLTDRAPGDDEVDRIRGAMDGLADATPLRSVFARLLVDSGRAKLPEKAAIDDPTAWVAALFERLLGRPATPDELRTFVTTFHEEACRPETILLALVTHPDYATW